MPMSGGVILMVTSLLAAALLFVPSKIWCCGVVWGPFLPVKVFMVLAAPIAR